MHFLHVVRAICVVAVFGCAVEAGPDTDDDTVEAGLFPEPMAVIGSEASTETMLWQPRSVAFTRSGNLLVADRDMTVREFTPSGQVVSRFGTVGSGPGEFRQLHWAYPIRGDSIAAFDGELRRLTVFTAEGRYGRSALLTLPYFVDAGMLWTGEMLGFQLPAQRVKPGDAWGTAPILLVSSDVTTLETADTVLHAVWLHCDPGNARMCVPHAEPAQQRRGAWARSGSLVLIAPADGGMVYSATPGALRDTAVVRLPSRGGAPTVETLLAAGGGFWAEIRDGTDHYWLWWRSDGRLARYRPITDATIRAATETCLVTWRLTDTGTGVLEVYSLGTAHERAGGACALATDV